METETFKGKKRNGDIPRIMAIVNAKRVSAGTKPYSKETIGAMLRGFRTMKPEVQEARDAFYATIEKLQE